MNESHKFELFIIKVKTFLKTFGIVVKLVVGQALLKGRLFFLTGLAVLLPTMATVALTIYLFNLLDSFLAQYLVRHYEFLDIPGIGIAFTLVIIILSGMLATNIVGQKLFDFMENLLIRIPGVSWVIRGIKQLLDTVVKDQKMSFSKVVMVKFPSESSRTIGFLIGPSPEEIKVKSNLELLSVFVPVTIIPPSGYVLFYSRDEIIELDMTVEQGLKLLISAGFVLPEHDNSKVSYNGKADY